MRKRNTKHCSWGERDRQITRLDLDYEKAERERERERVCYECFLRNKTSARVGSPFEALPKDRKWNTNFFPKV